LPKRISYIGSGKEYVHYTNDELENLRSIDMIDFLGRKEGFSFKQTSTYFKCVEHDSLVIYPNRRTWAWNSHDVKGKNVLDWLQRVDGLSFQEACMMLSPLETETVTRFKKTTSSAPTTSKEPSQKQLYIPEKTNGNYKNVYMYLTLTRCIDADIVSTLFHDKLIYQDTHNNACFVGYDENNNIRCVTQRGTNTYADKAYKGNTTGSMIEYSFNVPCNKSDPKAEINRVYLFEAPIDLLSHATIAKIVGSQKGDTDNCWKRQNRLALLGVSDVALQSYLTRNPNISEIVCCLDSDAAGREGAKNIMQKYGDRYKVSIHTPKNSKDYNEVLCKYIQQQKTVTQSDNIDNDVTYNRTSARR
jgi:hypothetical protein